MMEKPNLCFVAVEFALDSGLGIDQRTALMELTSTASGPGYGPWPSPVPVLGDIVESYLLVAFGSGPLWRPAVCEYLDIRVAVG